MLVTPSYIRDGPDGSFLHGDPLVGVNRQRWSRSSGTPFGGIIGGVLLPPLRPRRPPMPAITTLTSPLAAPASAWGFVPASRWGYTPASSWGYAPASSWGYAPASSWGCTAADGAMEA